MKKKQARKLTLHKETVRQLEEETLQDAAGAATLAVCTAQTRQCTLCWTCAPCSP